MFPADGNNILLCETFEKSTENGYLVKIAYLFLVLIGGECPHE